MKGKNVKENRLFDKGMRASLYYIAPRLSIMSRRLETNGTLAQHTHMSMSFCQLLFICFFFFFMST
jgi:hypothetical protein